MSYRGVGYYFTGDGAHRTEGGYYQITGRMDDVINISGHRLGTAEIEDAMVSSICLFICLVLPSAVSISESGWNVHPKSPQGLLPFVVHRLTTLLFQKLLSLGTLMTSRERVSILLLSTVEVHGQQGL